MLCSGSARAVARENENPTIVRAGIVAQPSMHAGQSLPSHGRWGHRRFWKSKVGEGTALLRVVA